MRGNQIRKGFGMKISAYAAKKAKGALEPFAFEPGRIRENEVEIEVTHCGICHSDVHMLDNDWGMTAYPFVPGHEIVGTVTQAGPAAGHLAKGDRVGVGWQASSCGSCEWCEKGCETCCRKNIGVIVGRHGGFADRVRVDGRFAFPIPETLKSESAAPLLCGGITVYKPLRDLARPWSRVGVIGIGGLGHFALQFARAFGCDVTAFSTTPDKDKEAKRLGAHHFVCTTKGGLFEKLAGTFDLLISAVTADLAWDSWMGLLRPYGTLVVVGASPGMIQVAPFSLIVGNRGVRGSVIGDPHLIREMLGFAARHKIGAEAEVLPMSQANEGLQRVRESKARYRIVLKR